MTAFRITAAVVFVSCIIAGRPTAAQDWRGMGRVAGKVVDENRKPIEGVAVKATLPSAGNRGPQSKSNAKGEWTIAGITSGAWALDFEKEGYETKSISVSVSEVTRIPPMELMMKKAAVVVDANQEIKDKLTRAASLMNAKEFAKARAIYEELTASYPEVAQFEPLIARAYYGEGNKAKAIEHLRNAVARSPDNVEVKLLLGNILIEEGKAAEGRQVLESVDDSKVTDPTVYVNVAIAMINEGRQAEAVTWLDKAVSRFPDQADAYYYRGIANVGIGKRPEAKADLEKFISIAAPDAPELPTAKKILESLK